MEEVTRFTKFIKPYKKSEIIFAEDTPGDEMYVIHSGRVKLSTKAPGREVDLATLGPGEFFGEMSLVDAAPRTATAVSLEDNTFLIALDQAKFLYLVSQQPAFALTIMHTLCQRIRERWKLYEGMLKQRDDPSDLAATGSGCREEG